MENVKKRPGLFAIFLFLTACSIQNHYSTLSFFFDGVTNHEHIHQAPVDPSVITTDTTTTLAKFTEPKLYLHLPYLEKKCAACHNQGRMGSLMESEPGLCYQCHTDLEIRYSFTHGPATGGFCSECHNPHKSTEEKLLLHPGEELCLGCHEVEQVTENLFHNISEETACLSCHGPHGSQNHSLLKEGSCYGCHDDFSGQYQVLHGPVAIGHCSECHTSHSKDSEKLLLKIGRDLCFNCHETERLIGDETHSYIDDASCIECHNPHGGEDRFLFY